MFISSQYPRILVRPKSLTIDNLIFNQEVENVFKKIEKETASLSQNPVAVKILLSDFFTASLLSGHLKAGKNDIVLLDVSPGAFINKKPGIYREPISKLTERLNTITLDDWVEAAISMLSRYGFLRSSSITERQDTLLKEDAWPKIIKKNQIFRELTWEFNKEFITASLPYLKN